RRRGRSMRRSAASTCTNRGGPGEDRIRAVSLGVGRPRAPLLLVRAVGRAGGRGGAGARAGGAGVPVEVGVHARGGQDQRAAERAAAGGWGGAVGVGGGAGVALAVVAAEGGRVPAGSGGAGRADGGSVRSSPRGIVRH